MWIDATVAASLVTNPKSPRSPTRLALRWRRTRARQERQLVVGVEPRHSGWLQEGDAAAKFIAWATSKEYTQLVASKEGWRTCRREPALALPESGVREGAPFAKLTLASIDSADPNHPTSSRCPMSACNTRHPGIPGHRHDGRPAILGGARRHDHRRCGAGRRQASTEREMKRAGYIK